MILIKDSLLVDGSGTDARRADILIKGEKISAIGIFPNKDADVVLDGMGMVTAPGFIDVNTDSDHYLSLFSDRPQEDFLLQGVTTIIGGNCGSSLAPLLYGTLESIRKWGDPNAVNVDWNTVGEFLKALDKLKLGVNFGTLVGHSTVRRAIIGEDLRDLTVRELNVFKSILEQAMQEGAFGLSTGLGYNHSKNVPFHEVRELVNMVHHFGGVYATHIRDEQDGIVESVSETIQLARESGVKTLISHFRPLAGFEPKFQEALGHLESAGNDGIDVHFDIYPFDYSILPVYMLLPEVFRHGAREQMLELLKDMFHAEEIIKAIPKFKGEDVTIAKAPGFDYLVGKTIAEFSKTHGLGHRQGLLAFMKMTKFNALVFKRNINFELVEKALFSNRSLVASNSPSLVEEKNVLVNERAEKTFSRYLEIVQKKAENKFPWAIYKITSLPAKILGLADRGLIKEGMQADLVMLRDNRAVNVLVNGKIAVRDSQLADVSAGKILRHK